MKISEEIDARMNRLAEMMSANYHLENPEEVENHINSISKFWRALSENDRDYINSARLAIEERREWKT